MKRNCFISHKEILAFLADNFDEPGGYIMRRHGKSSIYAHSPTDYDKSSFHVIEFNPDKIPEEDPNEDTNG